jgi:hypothetical protein
MKTIAHIIALHGGLGALAREYIRIEPPSEGYMRLVIERLPEPGPDHLPMLSVAHYFEQNGDPCTDPEMTFEIGVDPGSPWYWPRGKWIPVSFEMSYMAIHRRARVLHDGQLYVSRREQRDQESFARVWDRNIKAQGFVDAYLRQRAANPQPHPERTP